MAKPAGSDRARRAADLFRWSLAGWWPSGSLPRSQAAAAGSQLPAGVRYNTVLHGAVLHGGSISAREAPRGPGAKLDVRNDKGWTPLTIADGVEYTPDIFKRYPAKVLRDMMREREPPRS